MSKYHDAKVGWFNAHEETLDPTTLGAPKNAGYYLANRIERTFMDAYNIGFRHGKEEALERLKEVITK